MHVLEWDDLEHWTVWHVAARYGVAAGTVTREWVRWKQWPQAVPGYGKRRSGRGRPLKVYRRSEVEKAVVAHARASPEFGPPRQPEREWPFRDRVSLAEIARRLDRPYTEVRNHPRLYPLEANNPFPLPGPDGMRSWGDVINWHRARPGMGFRRNNSAARRARPHPSTGNRDER